MIKSRDVLSPSFSSGLSAGPFSFANASFKNGAHFKQRLGDRLLAMGIINRAQLDAAIQLQKNSGGRLGDILISQGLISSADCEALFSQRQPKLSLGMMLLNEGAITRKQLNQALEFQKKSGGLLGDILITMEKVAPEIVYRCLATQQQLGRVGHQFDFHEKTTLPYEVAKKHQVCIINRQNNRYILATAAMLSSESLREIESYLDMNVEQVLATQHEIDTFWSLSYAHDLTDESVNRLRTEMPENSAVETFTNFQVVTFATIISLIVIGCVARTKSTLLLLNAVTQIIYLAITTFKMYILTKGLDVNAHLRITLEELEALDEKELPVYTILVPVFAEKEIIHKLLNNIDRLDYPKAKLDVRLLLEEGDNETLEALATYDLPYYYTKIVVPHSLPQTKPKACNYGLIRARGEYVVIYDAEDRPQPDQLKKAYLAFRKLPEKYVCVQAKLNYYNSNQNLLTKWFTLEYSMWFEILLPGVVQLDIPVPLGGTSNHFKTRQLKEIGAWDPYNVTEDADLGVRLFKEGYVTSVIDSVTWEEANSHFVNWIRQRSRWIKGYMQTWLVHMRNPVKFYKELGRNGFFGFQAVILGSVLLPLVNPYLWIMMVLWYATKAAWIPELFHGAIYFFAAFLLVFGNFYFVYSNAVGMYWIIDSLEKKGEENPFSYRLVKLAFISPIYWIFMSIAAYKALWQLLTKPFHWEKTQHGLGDDEESIAPGL